MSKATISMKHIKETLMQDSQFREEYEKLRPRYELISQIIEARTEKKMTQEQLANLVGTQKSNISRLESGTYNPSLDFLIKIAEGLGKSIKIELIAKK